MGSNAHRGKVSMINFSESPFLLTSIGSDNSIRQWKLNKSNFLELVTEKSGHSTFIFYIRNLNNKNCLLSAGHDNKFFVYTIYSNKNISKSNNFEKENNQKKMNSNPIVSMDVCEGFHYVLCDVITAHENNSKVYTWQTLRNMIGKTILRPAISHTFDNTIAKVTCVAISFCGKYGLVGRSTGEVDRYNLQSGLHQGAYFHNRNNKSTKISLTNVSKKMHTLSRLYAHHGTVTAVSSDIWNRDLLSVGLDGYICVWNFHNHNPKNQINVGNPIMSMAFTRKNKKVAISSSDLTIKIYDYLTCHRLSLFKGHVAKITALQMDTHDDWLYSSSVDCTIRVWDFSKKICLQIICFSFAVVSLSLDPECNTLITCHKNQIGIYIWINKIKLRKKHTKLFSQEIKKKIKLKNENNKSTQSIESSKQKILKETSCLTTNDLWLFKDDKYIKLQKILNKDVYNASKMHEKAHNLVTLSRISDGYSNNSSKTVVIRQTKFEENTDNNSMFAISTLTKTQTMISDKYTHVSKEKIKIPINLYKKNGNNPAMAAKIRMLRYGRKSYTTGNYENLLNILEKISSEQNIKQKRNRFRKTFYDFD